MVTLENFKWLRNAFGFFLDFALCLSKPHFALTGNRTQGSSDNESLWSGHLYCSDTYLESVISMGLYYNEVVLPSS